MDSLFSFLFRRSNDISTFFLPNAYFFKRAILEFHQIPLWNTFQFLGQPYLADPQNFIFYLPNYLFVLLPIEPAMLLLLISHLLFAGVGAYFLAKDQFKLSKFSAIFTALAFALTPKIFGHLEAGHYTMINAFAWLPWFMLMAFRFTAKPTLKHCSLLAVISWLMYLNYINILYFSLLFYGVYIIFNRKITFKFIIHNSLFIILFFGLISPNLLAQLELSDLSTRKLMIFEYVAQPIWSFKLFLQNLLFPYQLTHLQFTTERILFPGIVIGLLSLLGFFSWRYRFRWFFAGWIIFSLLYSLGARIPFFIFFYKFFPLIKWMRITTRLWIISNLFTAMFAGLGLQRLRQKKLLMFLSLAELTIIGFKIFSQPTQPELLPNSFYTPLQKDESTFRTYCTTACFSLQRLGELNLNSVSANNPIQLLSFANYLQSAGGYQYWHYAPILPPYQSYDQQPQPNADLLTHLNVKYIASPYPLTDPGFQLNRQESNYWLYTLPTPIKYIYYSPNKIIVPVDYKQSNTLVLPEQYYPGWQAYDQNHETLTVFDAQPFRAVSLSPDTTEVTLVYQPKSLKISLGLFISSWLIIIYILGQSLRK